MPKPPARKYSAADISRELGVTRAAVSIWTKEGCPHGKAPAGSAHRLAYDLDEVKAWVKAKGKTLRSGGDQRSPLRALELAGSGGSMSAVQIASAHAEAKLRKDLAAAEKAELELERLKGDLIHKDEVREGQLARIARARAVLLGIPAGVAPDCLGASVSEIEALIRDRIYSALHELATDNDGEDDE